MKTKATVTTFRVSAAVMAVCAVVVWILAAASQEIGPRDAPPPLILDILRGAEAPLFRVTGT